MVVMQVQRMKRLLSLDRRPNQAWRPAINGLLPKEKKMPPIRKGFPLFDETWDLLKTRPAAFKKYKPPPKPRSPDLRLHEDYNPENFHEILGKFRFEARGNFNVEKAEKEAFDAAFALHLVGWLKVRPKFILGHVQGDTFALSYYRRWLEQKHFSPDAGSLEWVRLWEMNLGLEPPLAYEHLKCDKDRRKYGRKKTHMYAGLASVQASRFERFSIEASQEEADLLEKHMVRTY